MTTHDDNAARMFRTGHYNAYDGKGWQKCDEGLSVKASSARDMLARMYETSRLNVAELQSQPAFVVGQTISTLEEYEALPLGATVWPWDGERFWWWIRNETGYVCDMTMHEVTVDDMPEDGRQRVIRSLP